MGRHRRRPTHRRAIVVSALVAVSALAPLPAFAEVSITPTACGMISAPEVGDFVGTWSTNLNDDAFMKSYLKGAGDEPYTTATDDEKSCLADQLAANLTVLNPGFGNGRDPQLVRAVLASVVFNRAQSTNPADPKHSPDVTHAPESTSLNDALAQLEEIVPVNVPEVSPTLQVGADTEVGADAIVSGGPSATPIVSTHVGASFAPSSTPLPGPLSSLPTPADIVGLLGTVINSVTYRVCVDSAVIHDKCGLPLPLATPQLVDTTGDNVPDVTAELLPLVTTSGGAQIQFSVNQLPLLGGPPAAAHVYAVFSVIGTNRQFAVGFDGRKSHLGTANKMTFTLNSITRALNGDIDTGFKLNYTNPGTESAVTVDVATVTQGTKLSDPIDASLDFNPTPTTFTASLRIQDTTTPEYTVGINSSVPTTLTAHASIDNTAAGTRTVIDGVVKQLPTSVSIDLTNNGSVLTGTYSGSAAIGELDLSDRSIPNINDPTTYTLLSTQLTQIPTNANFVVTQPYDAVLSTNNQIGPSTLSLQKVAGGVVHTELFGSFTNLPTNVHVHGDVNGDGTDFTTKFTYTADAVIHNVHFTLYDDQDLHAFVDASASELPPYMQVSVAKHPHSSDASFDAQSSASAAPGSASVGPLTLKYTSTGTQLADADLPATDYVVLKQTTTDVQAALKYTGLALATYDLDDSNPGHDTVTAELRNAAQDKVTLEGQTPAILMNSVIDKVPSDLSLNYAQNGTATDVTYHASDPINEITAAVQELQDNHAAISADVMGVPTDITLAMDQAAGTIDWSSSDHLTSVALTGQVDFNGRTWVGDAELAGVPTKWSLDFGPSTYAFTSGTLADPQTLHSLSATLTNHGSASTEAGNHAFANYDQTSGDLDASFAMTDIQSFSYQPTDTGFTTSADMGGGQPFDVKAHLQLNDANAGDGHPDVIDADASIDPLPSHMSFTDSGTVMDYNSNTSPDIDASIAIGRADAVANVPTPPVVRGVSLRDGRSCDPDCATAYKAHLFLEGAPSGFHADLSNIDFTITHYAPPAAHPEFNADVVLNSDPDASKHFSGDLTLGGIDPSGTTMEIGPITTSDGPVPNSETTTVNYTGNHEVGPLDVTASFGDKTAMASVSNLPTTMTFSATTRPDGIQFSGDMDDVINKIQAFYKPTGAANWALSGALTDIPRHFTFSQLTIGDQPSSDPCAPPPANPPVPTIDYTATNSPQSADAADTLDITANVDLSQLSSSLTGQLQAGITNLGHATHATWDGSQLHITSTPDTDSLEVHVPNAHLSLDGTFGGPDPCDPDQDGFISFNVNGNYNIGLTIQDAGLVVTDVTDLTLQPGFSTGIKGTFGTLSFGWHNIHADVEAHVEVDVDINFGGGIEVDPTIASASASLHTDVDVDFHVYNQTADTFLTIPTPVPCVNTSDTIPFPSIFGVHVNITPNPVAVSTNNFTVNGPTDADGNAWVVTADPFGIIPDTVLDAITGLFTSPFDHGLGASFDCLG